MERHLPLDAPQRDAIDPGPGHEPMMLLEDRFHRQVEDLLHVLNQDIQNIEQSLLHLDSLRSMLVKQDEEGLNALLQQIRSETDVQIGLETERLTLRQQLAQTLGLGFSELTLSRLASRLPEHLSLRVNHKRERLRQLMGKLSREHLNTAWLLKDFQRFNQALFQAIFNNGNRTATYGANGLKQRQVQHNLMDMQF